MGQIIYGGVLKFFYLLSQTSLSPLETQRSTEFEPWTSEADHLSRPALSHIRSMTLTRLMSLKFLMCKNEGKSNLLYTTVGQISQYIYTWNSS